jgi:hypothetical protein
MSIALRCYYCKEWVHRPNQGWATCPCEKLNLSSEGSVSGFYSEFWNEERDLHFIYDTPKGC